MTTLVKADEKGRISIRGSEEGRKYLVTRANKGWWVMPAPDPRPPKMRRDWQGSKKTLGEHLRGLADEGLTIEQADNAKARVGPCRF
jgi:hypothetical protein